jgi:hypothetical protein
MPTTYVVQFTNVGVRPFLDPDIARQDSVALPASVSYLKGTVLGEKSGNNEVQTLTVSGIPTGGTFTMTFATVATAAIAYNATADNVRAAIEAHASFGVGTIKATGGPLPLYPVVIEFIGTKGNTNVAAFTTTDSLTGGSSPASAIATLVDGSAGTAGTYAKVSKATVASPTAAPTLAHTGSDGSLTANGVYKLAYSFANPTGETTIGPIGSVTAAATEHIGITTVVPPAGCWVNWYISDANGKELRWYSATTGALANITAEPSIGTPKPPLTNTAFVTTDGSQKARKILEFDCYTDASSNVTLGQASTGNEWAATEASAPTWYSGVFSVGDLVGFTDSMLADLGGKYISGSLANSGVISF